MIGTGWDLDIGDVVQWTDALGNTRTASVSRMVNGRLYVVERVTNSRGVHVSRDVELWFESWESDRVTKVNQ